MGEQSNQMVIVGLGNPGEQYRGTRHNLGFLVLDQLAKRLETEFVPRSAAHGDLAEVRTNSKKLILVKPSTFMNLSGRSVRAVLQQTSITRELYTDRLIVVYDDLDLPLGSWKLVRDSFPKQHNGVLSIIDELGSSEFLHLRIGIDSREGAREIPSEAYVLQRFSPEEHAVLDPILDQVVIKLQELHADS